MKKQLFLTMICAFTLGITQAQELIVGGNMESEDAWEFSTPNGSDVTDLVTKNFNLTSDVPSDGEGGCLQLTGFGTTRSVAWQKVTLTPGHSYSFTGYVKNISTATLTNTWIEIILSRTEPDPLKDYSAGTGDYIYQKNSWLDAPMGDFTDLDGEFIASMQFLLKGVFPNDPKDSVLTESTITISDTITVNDWYVAIKAGCWNTAGVEDPIFDFLFDEISLVDLEGVSVKNNALYNKVSIFPNPSEGIVNITINENAKIKVYNTLGKEIKTLTINKSTNSINLSNLVKDVYFMKVNFGTETQTSKLILE